MQPDVLFPRRLVAIPACLLACLLWSYWSTFALLAATWSADPQYSHGFLVPLIAAGLVWSRRQQIDVSKLHVYWWGLPVLLAGVALRLTAARYYFEWFDGVSLIPSLAGLCLLVGGWHAIRVFWPAVLFLGFMLPLPYTLEVALAAPLQGIATQVGTFALQTVGFAAVAEGNIIIIGDARVGVAEACSGLRMLVVFFAVSTAVALVIQRRLWERGLIIASAVPIALFCNITRITATGILYETASSELARLVYHDFAGWLMMPMALGILWIELRMLSRVFVEPQPMQKIPILPRRASATRSIPRSGQYNSGESSPAATSSRAAERELDALPVGQAPRA